MVWAMAWEAGGLGGSEIRTHERMLVGIGIALTVPRVDIVRAPGADANARGGAWMGRGGGLLWFVVSPARPPARPGPRKGGASRRSVLGCLME